MFFGEEAGILGKRVSFLSVDDVAPAGNVWKNRVELAVKVAMLDCGEGCQNACVGADEDSRYSLGSAVSTWRAIWLRGCGGILGRGSRG